MSVSIGYRTFQPKKLKYVDGGSTFFGILKDEFGEFPFILYDSNIGWLRGVASCGHAGAEELIRAISEFGKIEVEAEY